MRAPTRGEEATGTRRSRLRIVVIQALVLSLFATLLVRLYYLQVVTGEEYTAQAASQSVRDIVVQPQRGLIVDDMGRPLVTNRTAWVVSVDRTLLGRMGGRDRREVLDRVATVTGEDRRTLEKRLVTCGDEGSVSGTCWNGSPYQPVPVATDVERGVALRVLEQPEDYPSRAGRAADRARLPAPLRRQPRPRAGLPQPDHRGRARPGRVRRRRQRQRRLLGGPGRRREAVRRVVAGHARLRVRGGRLDGARAGRGQPRRRPAPATPWSPPSTPASRAWSRSSSPRRSRPRAPPPTP